MSLPLCTIVIPAYNAGVWIERTLQSVAQQTYPSLEVLVVDDGSADNTRILAEAMAAVDHRFRVLNIPNGGVANARNLGIREAHGEFVAFLDADDLWHPEKIALQMAAMEQLVDGVPPGASYALMRSIDMEDRVTGTGNMLGSSGFMLARHLYFKPVGNGSSVLVRRGVALELGGYDPAWAARGIGGCEDLDFELKVAAKYPIVCVPQLLIGYRKSPGNMSSNQLKMARGYLGVVERHLKANPQVPEWVTPLVYASTLGWTLRLLIHGRHWLEALRHLARMFSYQPGRAVRSLLERLFHSELRRAIRFLRRKIRRETPARPLFVELSPEIDTVHCGASLGRRDQKILKALTEFDSQLWRELRNQQHLNMNELASVHFRR